MTWNTTLAERGFRLGDFDESEHLETESSWASYWAIMVLSTLSGGARPAMRVTPAAARVKSSSDDFKTSLPDPPEFVLTPEFVLIAGNMSVSDGGPWSSRIGVDSSFFCEV
jgi:hypothetical protein